jgi:hypothetical protein
MTALGNLIHMRNELERRLAVVNRRIEALNTPKTPLNIRRRIKVWQKAVAILDACDSLYPGSPARRRAIKDAFRFVREHLGSTIVLRRSLASWAKTLIEEETQSSGIAGIAGMTRRKIGHLAVADVKEFKEAALQAKRKNHER